MESSRYKIVAKQNNHEIYLLAYPYKSNVGFICDFERGVRLADDRVEAIRKKGIWLDFQCSPNVAKRIMRRVDDLKAAVG